MIEAKNRLTRDLVGLRATSLKMGFPMTRLAMVGAMSNANPTSCWTFAARFISLVISSFRWWSLEMIFSTPGGLRSHRVSLVDLDLLALDGLAHVADDLPHRPCEQARLRLVVPHELGEEPLRRCWFAVHGLPMPTSPATCRMGSREMSASPRHATMR